MASLAPREEEWWGEEENSESEGEEGGPGPPYNVFSLVLPLSFPSCLIFLAELGRRRDGDPSMTGSVSLRSWKKGYVGEPTAVPSAAACSGITNKR